MALGIYYHEITIYPIFYLLQEDHTCLSGMLPLSLPVKSLGGISSLQDLAAAKPTSLA